ncbi:type II secretion system protein [Pseudomonas sp. VD9]|uniref:type II secretion system protein n=1 Tax=Pseudomonas sp. VD9 TaxID=3342076 RepID=UPI003C6CC250
MWQGPPSHHCAKGFTLIELLLTLALLATLSTVAYPLTALMGKRDRELDLQRSLREIRRAIDSYKEAADDGRIQKSIGDSGYPPTLQALVDHRPDRPQRQETLLPAPHSPRPRLRVSRTVACPNLATAQLPEQRR